MIDRKTLRLSAVLLVVGFSLYVMVGLLHPDLGSGRLTAIRHQRISGAARPGHPARRRHRPYRRFSRIGEAVVDVAERIVYAVVKQS